MKELLLMTLFIYNYNYTLINKHKFQIYLIDIE